MLLCMFVGTAWAQVTLPATDKAFTVIAEGHNSGAKPGWAINNGKTAMVSFGDTDVADEAQKNFAFIQYEGKVYLYSVWAEKFVNKDMSLTDKLPVDDITVENVDGGKYFFKYDDSHNMNIGGSKQLAPDGWSTKDGGNQYTLTEVDSFDPAAALAILDNSYEIIYQFKYNGKLVATQTTKIAKGANYPAVNAELLPWGAVASVVPTGAPTENETIELTCSVDVSLLPFVPADSYNDAEMKWYYLQFHSTDKNYLYYTEENTVLLTDKSALDKNDKDAYTWAFVGNPFDGYTIYNRKAYNADNDLKLNAASAGAVLGKNDHKFKPTASAHAVKGFFLASEQGENTNRFNRQGGKVVYWTGADAGSTFMVTERPMGAVAELEALIEEAEALLTSMKANEGTLMGQYSAATITTFETAISTAKDIDEAAITSAHVEALQAAMDAVKRNLPTPGKYYLIHSSLSKFAEHQAGKVKAAYSDGTNVKWTTANEDDKTFYWQAVATNDGAVVLQNAMDGKYMTGNKDRSGAWTVSDTYSDAAKLDMMLFAKGGTAAENEYGVILNGWQMHCEGHGEGKGESGNVVSWNTDAANSASSWYVVEVELPVFYDVTYNFVYNKEVKFTKTVSIKKDAAYPEVVVPVIPYGVTTNAKKPEGAVTQTEVINFELIIEKELPVKAAANVESIDTWYFMQMHGNTATRAYIEDNGGAVVDWNDKSVANDEIESHLWGFVGDVFGMKMVNRETGKAIASTGSGNATMAEVATATSFVVTASNGQNDPWFCMKHPDNNNYLNAQGDQSNGLGCINHYYDNDNGSSFFATEYKTHNVVVGEAGYATLYLGSQVFIPETVEAYVVSEISNDNAIMTQVTGSLPANTGVILKGSGTHQFITSADVPATIETNLLAGTVVDTYVAADAYVLANGEDGIGFYTAKKNFTVAEDGTGTKVEEGGSHFLNNANKAYLPASAVPAGARFLSFDFGNETAIENIEGAENAANAVIYDLSGRRVQKAQKGLYIVNGVKVIK